VAGQLWQSSPLKPQAEEVVPGWQTLLASQHPGHVLELQVVSTHFPPSHCEVGSHEPHDAPPVPQANGSLPGWQAPVASQQPVGHVPALQTEPRQLPFEQVAPALHVAHWFPAAPQAAAVSPTWQTSCASQHPPGQLVMQVDAWQAPPRQTSPAGHDVHAAPPLPQSFTDPVARQMPLASQQPVGHVCTLHAEAWQLPALQSCPA